MSIQDKMENGTLKLNIFEGIPVSLPAIHVIGLCGDLSNAGDGVVVVVTVVVVVGVVVVVVETLWDCPEMNFFRLNGFIPLCLACP